MTVPSSNTQAFTSQRIAFTLALFSMPLLLHCGSEGPNAMSPSNQAATRVSLETSRENDLPKVATIGKPCADILGIDSEGQQVTLKQFEGKVIVLDVSATWCGPCNAEAPNFNQLYEKHKDQEVVCITCIADGAKQSAATAWKKKHNMTMPVMVDSQGKTGPAEAFYRKSTGYYPTFVIIDKSFTARYKGSPDHLEEVENALKSVLAQ